MFHILKKFSQNNSFKYEKINILYFISILACNSVDDNRADTIKLMIDEVSYLSSDELEGRETGTIGEKKLLNILVQNF